MTQTGTPFVLRAILLWTVLPWAALPGCRKNDAWEGPVLKLATTTSTESSGLLRAIHPDFEATTGIRVMVIAQGSGASLALGRSGDVDVVLVHDPEAEARFVADGYGVDRRHVMHNDFVLIGPRGDPAGARSVPGITAALAAVARSGQVFVSRGDGSGTHVKETDLWKSSGVELRVRSSTVVRDGVEEVLESTAPAGAWYHSVGMGMGRAIVYATQKQAYTLADRGTYYAFALEEPPRTDLVILCEGDPRLANPYGVVRVSPERFPGVAKQAALEYVDWLLSDRVQAMIGGFTKGGKVLFHPAREAPAEGRAGGDAH